MLVIYDDATARTFAPFSLTRPIGALRAGAKLIGARWATAFRSGPWLTASSPHLDGFTERGVSGATGVLSPGTIVANSRCVVTLSAEATIGDAWRIGDALGAVRLAKPLPVEALHDGSMDLEHLAGANADVRTLPGRWLDAPWDLIAQLPAQLAEDVARLSSSTEAVSMRAHYDSIIGDHPVIVEEGAQIEPYVVFDTSAGAVIVRAGAHINAFSRIAGPCVIGRHTHILGGRISGCAIGDDCRIHGDVSASIFVGHGNKAHEGFVGHSIVGRWANLGAGTTTSNLKNSYGAVRMWSPEGERDTGLTFLGSLIGDHAKLGIGTMLGTGTVVGAGANVFGTMRPPKRVHPFAWGDAPPFQTFSRDKFIDVAGRVMERRKVSLGDKMRQVLAAAHDLAATDEW
jgi:UDP-N-acetylglucosamine diphosphorylase/glucosamine-1-phosphate N-acetyltransferase